MPKADGLTPTHAEWQDQVLDLAHALGWRHLHVRRSIGKGKKWVTATNVIGWPDLLLWHPARGGFIAAELKIPGDTIKPEQKNCLEELAAAGMPSFVWWPDQLDIIRTLLDELRGAGLGDQVGWIRFDSDEYHDFRYVNAAERRGGGHQAILRAGYLPVRVARGPVAV